MLKASTDDPLVFFRHPHRQVEGSCLRLNLRQHSISDATVANPSFIQRPVFTGVSSAVSTEIFCVTGAAIKSCLEATSIYLTIRSRGRRHDWPPDCCPIITTKVCVTYHLRWRQCVLPDSVCTRSSRHPRLGVNLYDRRALYVEPCCGLSSMTFYCLPLRRRYMG